MKEWLDSDKVLKESIRFRAQKRTVYTKDKLL